MSKKNKKKLELPSQSPAAKKAQETKTADGIHQRNLFKYHAYEFLSFYKKLEEHVQNNSELFKRDGFLIAGHESIGLALRQPESERVVMLDLLIYKERSFAALSKFFDTYQVLLKKNHAPKSNKLDMYRTKHLKDLLEFRNEASHSVTINTVDNRLKYLFNIKDDLHDIAYAINDYWGDLDQLYPNDTQKSNIEIVSDSITDKWLRKKANNNLFKAALSASTFRIDVKYGTLFDHKTGVLFQRDKNI